MPRQPITLTPDYNWTRLKRDIVARLYESFIIVGRGARHHRRLLERVLREIPEALDISMLPGFKPWEYAVLVNRSAEAISWSPSEPGKPPVVEHEQGWADKRAAVEASVAMRAKRS
jgi:hypothetical protein